MCSVCQLKNSVCNIPFHSVDFVPSTGGQICVVPFSATRDSGIFNRSYCCIAGGWMGNVVALPLSGVLCRYGFNGGWPSVFYVIGKQNDTRGDRH